MIDINSPKAKIIFQVSGYLDVILLYNQQTATSSADTQDATAALDAITNLRQLAAIHYAGNAKQIERILNDIQPHLLQPDNDEKNRNAIAVSIEQLDKLFGTWAI